MSGYTKRYIVVCRADLADAANTALHNATVDLWDAADTGGAGMTWVQTVRRQQNRRVL